MKYLALHLLGATQEFAATDFAAGCGSFVAHPVEPIAWQLAVMALTVAIVAAGVEQ